MMIDIVGAGMAGLLAGNILRRHRVGIYERQSGLPNNHSATLRFRSPVVGEVLGIQFKKVNIIKTYVPSHNIVADSLSYSKKVTGMYLSDRSIISGTSSSERWISPPDLIAQMSKGLEIFYDKEYNFNVIRNSVIPIISTIPMPDLMNLLGYKFDNIKFRSTRGVIITGTIQNCDSYISVLFPGNEAYSRATITGDELIVEFPGSPNFIDIYEVYPQLGISTDDVIDIDLKEQLYFKITEIDESERKKFMRWATVNHNIYSLGRFATWRPKLLLDDLVADVRKIEKWITGDRR